MSRREPLLCLRTSLLRDKNSDGVINGDFFQLQPAKKRKKGEEKKKEKERGEGEEKEEREQHNTTHK